MAIYINTNIGALIAANNLNTSQATLSQSLARLSSGLRINSAADDPAGSAIVSRMTAQIGGMIQAGANINNGIALLQTADSAMSGITGNLQRIRDLSVQSANGSNSANDRLALDAEVQQLKAQIQQVADTTMFNGISLLDGSANPLSLLVGPTQNDTIQIGAIQNMQLAVLGSSGAGSMVAGTSTVAALNAGDLTLNGVAVGASAAGAGIGDAANSALEIAAAINTVTPGSGVTATASTTLAGSAPGSNAVIQDFILNGVTVSTAGSGVTNLAAAINQANTGFSATINSAGGVTLTASNGQNMNIELSGTAGTAAIAASDRAAFLSATGLPDSAVGTEATAAIPAVPGVPAQYDIHGNLLVAAQPGQSYVPPSAANYATTTGIVTLKSNDTLGILIGGNAPGSAGFFDGLSNQNATSTVPGIAALNVLTQSAAQRALLSMDSAILMVTNAQAQIGADENRLASAASTNQTGLVNLSASRSTIQDTNYASELVRFSTSRILEQAGTAMLAHANATTAIVKNLLR